MIGQLLADHDRGADGGIEQEPVALGLDDPAQRLAVDPVTRGRHLQGKLLEEQAVSAVRGQRRRQREHDSQVDVDPDRAPRDTHLRGNCPRYLFCAAFRRGHHDGWQIVRIELGGRLYGSLQGRQAVHLRQALTQQVEGMLAAGTQHPLGGFGRDHEDAADGAGVVAHGRKRIGPERVFDPPIALDADLEIPVALRRMPGEH